MWDSTLGADYSRIASTRSPWKIASPKNNKWPKSGWPRKSNYPQDGPQNWRSLGYPNLVHIYWKTINMHFQKNGCHFLAKKKPLREYRCEHPTFKNHKTSLFYTIYRHFIQYFINYRAQFSKKYEYFINKLQICTFKILGVIFRRKKSPCGNTAASTQLLKIIKYSRIAIIKYKIS